MFTGIVSGVGRVVEVRALGSGASFGKSLTIAVPGGWLAGTSVGDSIALSGACMTVVSLDAEADRFTVEVSAESLAATHGLDVPGAINLEKALRAGDRLDGHLVGGHVDGVGTVTHFERVGESWALRVAAPAALARFIALKGSIAVDGISLTVTAVTAGWFEVSLIPETLKRTTLGTRVPGDTVNLEVDVIAKHVERLMQQEGDK